MPPYISVTYVASLSCCVLHFCDAIYLTSKHGLENTSYDKDDISAKTMAEIRKKYVTDTRFTPEAAEKASKAAAGMCKWVYAMETYDRVAKVMHPRQSLNWTANVRLFQGF